MRVSHPIGRIGELNRGNIAPVRQIESIGSRDAMIKSDTTLAQIAARFARHDVEWNRGAYVIVDRRTAHSIARLRPIPDTDRFELFYWSNVKERWTTFGNLGRMKLRIDSAHEIVENDPMFRVQRSR
jgi:hypothetical protein